MNRFFLARRSVLLGTLVLLGLALGLGTYWLYWKKKPVEALPEPGTPKYQEYAEAFQIGVAALDVGQEERARKHLDQAIALIPQEPAAWADRGLLNLRTSGTVSIQAFPAIWRLDK
jgi:hypothetical protein